jgi:hypothetical protein
MTVGPNFDDSFLSVSPRIDTRSAPHGHSVHDVAKTASFSKDRRYRFRSALDKSWFLSSDPLVGRTVARSFSTSLEENVDSGKLGVGFAGGIPSGPARALLVKGGLNVYACAYRAQYTIDLEFTLGSPGACPGRTGSGLRIARTAG